MGQGFLYRQVDHSGQRRTYSVRADELRDAHAHLVMLDDQSFRSRIGDALHCACIVGWISGLDSDQLVSDVGIVHQLVHLLTGNEGPGELAVIRRQFAELTPPNEADIASFLARKGIQVEEFGVIAFPATSDYRYHTPDLAEWLGKRDATSVSIQEIFDAGDRFGAENERAWIYEEIGAWISEALDADLDIAGYVRNRLDEESGREREERDYG